MSHVTSLVDELVPRFVFPPKWLYTPRKIAEKLLHCKELKERQFSAISRL
jgi:hypothetical protein